MNRVRRSLIILAVSLVVTLIALVVRWLNAGGMFTEVKPGFSGTCTAIAAPPGAGDIAVDAQDGLVFVAASDRRAADKASTRDGLYAFAFPHPEGGLKKLAGTPRNFHPRNLSLYRAPGGGLTLMAVDRPPGGAPAILVFDVAMKNGVASLNERSTVSGGLLVRPEGIAAVGPDRFYVANSTTSSSGLSGLFETYALMPRANVLYFDGNFFRIVAQDLRDARGVFLSSDGNHLYVASKNGRTLYSFARAPISGQLNPEGELSIDAGLDDIDSDGRGGLLVAGTPRPFDEERYRDDPQHRRAPSQVFEVSLKNGIPASAEPIYTDKGTELSDAGTAVMAPNGHMFVGSPLDKKILNCTPEGTAVDP